MRQLSSPRGRILALLAVLALTFTLLPNVPASAEPTQPSAPATATISHRATMAIVAWQAVAGADGYVVELDTSDAFTTARRVYPGGTITVLTGLQPETTYSLRLASWLGEPATAGDWGAVQHFTTSAREFALAPPVVKATSLTSTSITLTWKALGDNLTYEAAIGSDPDDLSDVQKVKGELTATFEKLEKTSKYYLSARALDASGNPVTAWSDPVDEETAASLPLRVGSYNILCENCSGGMAKWASRRGPLVSAIRGEDLDVLGVQEASIGRIPGGGTQYMDLINRLGSPYKLTNYGRSNSPDVRIIYNSDRVKLLKQGTIALPRGGSARYLNWAVMQQLSTGKKFFFTNTHLEPKDGKKYWGTRNRQAKAIVAATKRLAGKLPVISVGDYATTKWDKPSNGAYDIMQAAGFKDPLGNAARSHNSAPGAFVEKRINTSFASYNMYKRKARNFSGDVNGSNTDYIFVTPMRVSEYEVVVKINSSGEFVGVIPSDHNLIRATVYLP